MNEKMLVCIQGHEEGEMKASSSDLLVIIIKTCMSAGDVRVCPNVTFGSLQANLVDKQVLVRT